MKTFREYVNTLNLVEEIDIQTVSNGGSVDFTNAETLQNINVELLKVGNIAFISHWQGLEKLRKVLATWNIFLPAYEFEGGESEGELVFGIQQFGEKTGDDIEGQVSADETMMYLYIYWLQNQDGTFTVDAEIMDEDDINDIIGDDETEEVDDPIYYNNVEEETETVDESDWHDNVEKKNRLGLSPSPGSGDEVVYNGEHGIIRKTPTGQFRAGGKYHGSQKAAMTHLKKTKERMLMHQRLREK